MTTRAPATAERSTRLSMRIAPDALDTIREAAAAQQQDVTSFVLGAAMDRARAVLAEQRVLALTTRESTQLQAELDRDPRVIPELLDLVRTVNGRRLSPASTSATH
jgi:uncharacterized protein (DUF1778 family)